MRYTVKKVRRPGRDHGKWGVYLGVKLMYAYNAKKDATRDADRRNDAEGRW